MTVAYELLAVTELRKIRLLLVSPRVLMVVERPNIAKSNFPVQE